MDRHTTSLRWHRSSSPTWLSGRYLSTHGSSSCTWLLLRPGLAQGRSTVQGFVLFLGGAVALLLSVPGLGALCSFRRPLPEPLCGLAAAAQGATPAFAKKSSTKGRARHSATCRNTNAWVGTQRPPPLSWAQPSLETGDFYQVWGPGWTLEHSGTVEGVPAMTGVGLDGFMVRGFCHSSV